MKKEDLIEKYPDVLAEIVKDLIRKGSNKPNLLNELWNEYLEENKPKNPDFKVVGLKLPHYSELWLNEKTNHFCPMNGKDAIKYEKGLLLGEVFSVKYKGKQFSIGDVVQYLDKVYEIQSFNKERVHLKLKNGNYYYEPHISEIIKLKSIGVTEDGFDYYLNDPLQWIIYNSLTKNWEFLYQLTAWENHPNLVKESNTYKIFHNKDNALKFIEENNKKVLFVTQEGIEISEGDEFYYLTGFSQPYESIIKEIATKNSKWKSKKTFSKYENAEQEQLKNAKVLSYDDIMIYLPTSGNSDNEILNLVKERLNQK